MKTELIWKFMAAAAMICSVAAIVFAVAFGACDGMIETMQGKQIPMKCHWTMIAAGLVSVLALVCGITEIFVNEKAGRRALAAVLSGSAVVIFLIQSDLGIGVCAAEGMPCHTMAMGLKVTSLCLLAIGVIQLIRPEKGDAPRRDL